MQNLIIYQIYPRSFKDSNGDGIGDINGIIEKLDYLADLGVNAVWISPIYPSPMADFGYDVSDYKDIDPIFGSLKDFNRLVKAAHKRGIKILMDYVLNHSSDQHPWFIESRSSRKSKKRDWYIWRDPVDGKEPNNWMSVFEKSAWAWDETTGQYYYHSFLTAQPDLNWTNPEVVEAMKDVMKFWFDLGVDGFRLDAVNFLWKHDGYQNAPINPKYVEGQMEPYLQLLPTYSKDQDEIFTVLKDLGEFVKQSGDKILLTEAYPDERGIDAIVYYKKYYDRLDSNVIVPFNFEFIFLPWTVKDCKSFIDEYLRVLDHKHLPIFVLGNHDRSRIASRIGSEQARIAAMLLLTLPGIPIVYNGEELGMHDVSIPPSQIKDPYALRDPRFGRDPERTPLQWDDTENAGFTHGKPWLPIADDFKDINVEKETKDKTSMFNIYKTLIHFRKNSPIILHGKYSSLHPKNESVYVFIREYKDEKILVLLNFSDKEQILQLPFKKGRVLHTSFLDQKPGKAINLTRLTLRANEGFVISI